MSEFQRLTGCSVIWKYYNVDYSSIDAPEGQRNKFTIAPPGGKLRPLARVAELIAKETGAIQSSVTWWILCGMPPLIHRVLMESSRRVVNREPLLESVKLQINAPDVTWRELWSIYKEFCSNFPKKKHRILPMHYRIYELVQEQGGQPRRDKTVFWDSTRKQLKAENLPAPSRWQSVRKAYFKVKERLGTGPHRSKA